MKRWRIELEITFDPKQNEANHRALERVKVILNKMLNREPEINHFHILKSPHSCYESD